MAAHALTQDQCGTAKIRDERLNRSDYQRDYSKERDTGDLIVDDAEITENEIEPASKRRE